jgi:hypothetical protein
MEMKKFLKRLAKRDPNAIEESYEALKDIDDPDKYALFTDEETNTRSKVPFKVIEKEYNRNRGMNVGPSVIEEAKAERAGRNPYFTDPLLMDKPTGEELVSVNPEAMRDEIEGEESVQEGLLHRTYDPYDHMNPQARADQVLRLKQAILKR